VTLRICATSGHGPPLFDQVEARSAGRLANARPTNLRVGGSAKAGHGKRYLPDGCLSGGMVGTSGSFAKSFGFSRKTCG
jgi:hypothetical protein